MAVKLKKVGCGHRNVGRDGPAIEIVFVTANGKRCPVGKVCANCATTWGPRGFVQFATMHIIAAIAAQPQLGPVQITFDGIEPFYSTEQRAELLAGCAKNLRTCAEQAERLSIRESEHTIPSAEMEQIITFSV